MLAQPKDSRAPTGTRAQFEVLLRNTSHNIYAHAGGRPASCYSTPLEGCTLIGLFILNSPDTLYCNGQCHHSSPRVLTHPWDSCGTGAKRAPLPINLTALRAYRCAAQGGAGAYGPFPLASPSYTRL